MSDQESISQYTAAFTKALHEGDGKACAALCAENAVLMPPEEAPVVGSESISRHFAGLGADTSVQIEMTNLEISGDLALQQSRVSWDADDGRKYTDSFEVLQRQADGSWRCLASSWNSVAGFNGEG